MPYGGLQTDLGGPTGLTREGTFTSEIPQVTALDVPETVTLGSGGNSLNNHAVLAATGVLTILTAGYYALKQRFRVGRTGVAGISRLFFWAEMSTDAGVTWTKFGDSVDVSLDSSNENTIFFDIPHIKVTSGTMLRNRFVRSSTGDNSGGLLPSVPSLILENLGVPSAPSAQLTLYKL